MTRLVAATSLGPVINESRGAAVKARREHLGMTVIGLAKLAKVDRGKLGRFEEGLDAPSERWINGVERALEAWEVENGHEPGEGAQVKEGKPLRFTFHDVYGIGELIAEGPIDRPDELVASIAKLLAEIRGNRPDRP